MIIITAAVMLALCGWCIILDRRGASRRAFTLCLRVLFAALGCGILCLAASAASFFIQLRGLPEADAQVIYDAYILFWRIGGILALAVLAVGCTAVLIRHKMTVARLLVSFLGALLVLIVAGIVALWSDYSALNVALYIRLSGVGCALTLALAPALDMLQHTHELNTEGGVRARQLELETRRRPSEERRRIRQMKKKARGRK